MGSRLQIWWHDSVRAGKDFQGVMIGVIDHCSVFGVLKGAWAPTFIDAGFGIFLPSGPHPKVEFVERWYVLRATWSNAIYSKHVFQGNTQFFLFPSCLRMSLFAVSHDEPDASFTWWVYGL